MLHIVDWYTAPLLDGMPHAWLSHGPQGRSVCDLVPWRPTLVAATPPAEPCPVCREIVAGAAFRSLEEIAGLEA